MPSPVRTLLAALLLANACAPAQRTSSRPAGVAHPSTPLGRAIDRFITQAEALGYSGVWLIQHQGRPILDKAYGFSDRDAGVRFTRNSLFPLGSIPKQFTASAILALQDEKRLSVSDSITTFFAEVPADKRGITIHHLLTHTAGLPTYSGPDDELITRDTLIARMMRAKLRTAPGAKFHYSNSGYSLLAAIIEIVTGERYDAFLRNRILAPLGMSSTVSQLRGIDRSTLPLAYLGDRSVPIYRYGDKGYWPDGTLSWNLVGGAGYGSTTGDMGRWAEAWRRGTILSDSGRKKALQRHVRWEGDTSRYYGYGWILEGPPTDRLEWHSGGDGASAAYFTRYVDRDLTTISYTNHSQGPSQLVLASVRNAVRGAPLPDLPSARIQLGTTAVQKLTGSYLLPSGDTITVTTSNGQLVVPLSRKGAAAAVTCFPPLQDSSRVRDIDQRVSHVFSSLSRNDLGPALAAAWPGVSLEEERQYWTATWPEWMGRYGGYRGIELIGSRPGTSSLRAGVPLIDTYFFIRFERGQYLVTVKQDPNGRLYFDTSTTALLQPRYYFVPQTANTFETYNFALKTRSPLSFDLNDSGSATGAIIGCASLHARRL